MSKEEMAERGEESVKGADNRGGASLGERIAKLDTLAEWFYSDEFRLEEAAGRYREAMQLAQEIETDLGELKNEIEVLAEDFSK